MKKRHIPGFFDTLVRTPAFLFLCAMFLCGAAAGGLTGLHADEGDRALSLTGMIEALPGNLGGSVISALIWTALPVLCGLMRPAAMFLSGLCAARGFVLALTIAVSLSSHDGFMVSLCTAGIPALLSVPALLAACAIVWPRSGEAGGILSRDMRLPYVICLLLAALSALLRAGTAALF